MAPPGIFSFYENNIEKNNTYHSNTSLLLLSPFPSISSCINPSVLSDHDYLIKDNDDIDTIIESPTLDDAFGCPPNENQSEAMTPDADVMSPSPLSKGDSEVRTDVFHDVPLVKQGTPLSSDQDFLEDLDELDFDFCDFEDLEPSRDVSFENDFQNFIDATLDNAMDVAFLDSNNNTGNNNNNNSNNDDDGEDVYKKEFFFKLLGLQKVSSPPSPTSPSSPTSTQHKNRKRKYEDSDIISQPSSKFPEISSNRSFSSFQNLHISLRHNKDNGDSVKSTSSTLLCSPSTLTVPSKLCSCSTNDWQRSVLYSTAKSSSITSVQTSPSTASGQFRHHRNKDTISNSRLYPSSSSDICGDKEPFSPSMVFSDQTKDHFSFHYLEQGELSDEDTEDLLKWLDNQDIQTTISGNITSNGEMENCFTSKYATSSNAVNSKGQESVSSCSSWAMDSFIDLESYVTEEPPSSKMVAPVDTVVNQLANNDDNNNNNNDSNNNNTSNQEVFSKSQLRLSILADISKEIINSEYNKRKDAIKRDILKSCRLNSDHVTKLNFENTETSLGLSECTGDLSFTSSSSSSSCLSGHVPNLSSSLSSLSSSPSSPVTTDNTRHSKNLNILDLFSDENSPMLLSGLSDSLSSARFM